MFTPYKIILFLIANMLGFLSVGMCFGIAVLTGWGDFSDPSFSTQDFKTHFITGTMITWLVCAVFSLGWFFIKGRARFIFLWAPVVLPLIYGLSVLNWPSL